jgi:hypothetical protein
VECGKLPGLKYYLISGGDCTPAEECLMTVMPAIMLAERLFYTDNTLRMLLE